MNVLICVLVWLLLAVVATIRFTRPVRFSLDERERLLKAGDKTATEEAYYLKRRPLYASLHFVIVTLLSTGFVTTCIVLLGFGSGIAVGAVGLLIVPFAYRISFICTLADGLRDISLPVVEKVTTAIGPFLSLLRDRELPSDELRLNSQAELLSLIEHSSGVLSPSELERLVASLKFDDSTVGDVMTPKSVIEAVEAKETLGPLVLDELYKTGYSRFPVYKKDIDHVVGVLYLHDLISVKNSTKTASEAMQPKVFYIRSDRDLAHALHGFIRTHHHLFVVVNEYRETVGLLTLEDVLEKLIGRKIIDEFDAFDDLRAVAEHNPKKNNQPEGKKDI